MLTTVSVQEAKMHLSRLLERVGEGEEIIIAKAGRPLARLIPAGENLERREPGSAAGKVVIGEDFDAPLPGGIAVNESAFDFWQNEEDEVWNMAGKE
jgi:prevent-host-death family protein